MKAELIRNVIEIAGSQRILFGSDSLYSSMLYNMLFVYLAAQMAAPGRRKTMQDMLLNMLGGDYFNAILS